MSSRPVALHERQALTGSGTRALRLRGSRPLGQRAAARLFLVNLALAALTAASAIVILVQLLETWRVGPAGPRHVAAVLGARISYPAANASAIAVAALAAVGVVVVLGALRAVVRESRAQWRFRRVLAERRIARVGDAWLVDEEGVQAFCAGLVRPAICVSYGALERLSESELEAVLAHERHHAERRDPLRLAVARVLAGALFFLPPVRALVTRQYALAEIGADEAAVAARDGDRAALASAMLRFAGGEAGVAPERIDHLVGETPSWRLPVALLALMCAGIGSVGALAVLLAAGASGSASLAPPLLAAQPCVLLLASIPVAVLVVVAMVRRGRGAAA